MATHILWKILFCNFTMIFKCYQHVVARLFYYMCYAFIDFLMYISDINIFTCCPFSFDYHIIYCCFSSFLHCFQYFLCTLLYFLYNFIICFIWAEDLSGTDALSSQGRNKVLYTLLSSNVIYEITLNVLLLLQFGLL